MSGPVSVTFAPHEPSESAATPEYLTVSQVAVMIGVDTKTITRWSRTDPSMPVLRRGRVVRFHRLRVLDWLQRQEPRASRKLQHTGSTTQCAPIVSS